MAQIDEQLGTLDLMLANLLGNLTSKSLDPIRDTDSSGRGAGMVSIYVYDVEYVTDDGEPYFNLNMYSKGISLTHGEPEPEPEWVESDMLGDTFEEAREALVKHYWFKKKKRK